MKNIAALAIICICVMVCVSSCSWTAVERSRIEADAKENCVKLGLGWDYWAETCSK